MVSAVIRSIITRADFAIEWEPSAELLGRGVEEPLLGDPLNLLFGRERPADQAILLVRARDLRPLHSSLDLAGLGYSGPDDLVSLAWASDAAEAVGIARAHLSAGDVVGVTLTTVPVGPHLTDVEGWRADRIGPFLAQSRAFIVEVDLTHSLPEAADPSGFDQAFLNLAGITVERDEWADRDLVGDDLARWRA